MAKGFLAKHKCAVGIVVVIIIAAIIGIVLGVTLTGSSSDTEEEFKRGFTIDHTRNTFLMDGKPFQYIAGSFHYFRAHPKTWTQKLKTLKAGGLNAVDLYVHWALHNPKDGVFNWDGIADVEEFIRLATAEGLYIILRPGPYICAEIDNGGLPYWLATKYPGIQARTNDKDYLREVEKWYSILMPRFESHFYGNGGNIIMVQIENEYGVFDVCDDEYKEFLRDETKKYTQDNAILFTVDRPVGNELKCGLIKDVFATVDFGISSFSEVEYNFAKLREVQPTGPLVNTEFYTGWFTGWQQPNARKSASDVAQTLKYMLLLKANVDFYMYFGGTNFGFWAGANDWGIGRYLPDITSYDYDAPMDEAGNPTDKYMVLRDVIKEFVDIPDESEIPSQGLAFALPAITVRPVDSILSANGRNMLGTRPIQSDSLLTFENLNQFSGFVLYETILPKLTRDPSNLIVTDLRDRAQVFIDDEFVGTLSRENYISTLPISANFGSKLSILVENQGRINFYQIADDYKGIRGNVRVQTFHDTRETFQTLTNWTITGFSFDSYVNVEHFSRATTTTYTVDDNGVLYEGPIVLYGEFEISEREEIRDTWWNTEGWGKGFIYINGFNLGRYWPAVGPQMTLYIPKDLLMHGKNEVQIVELQNVPFNFRMNFVDGPIFKNDQKV